MVSRSSLIGAWKNPQKEDLCRNSNRRLAGFFQGRPHFAEKGTALNGCFQTVEKPMGERERDEALSHFHRPRPQVEHPSGFQAGEGWF